MNINPVKELICLQNTIVSMFEKTSASFWPYYVRGITLYRAYRGIHSFDLARLLFKHQFYSEVYFLKLSLLMQEDHDNSVCVCVCVCVCVRACVRACVHARMCACLHVRAHVSRGCVMRCPYGCVACMHAWLHVCMHVCLYVCIVVRMCAWHTFMCVV